MHGAVIIGPGMPGGSTALARVAFHGAAFRTHVELADRLGLPAYIATPKGPISVDTKIEARRRWSAAKLAAAVIRWAQASDFATIVALADDADVEVWSRGVGPRLRTPLVGLSPDQRRSLARLLAGNAPLPAWVPGEVVELQQAPAEMASEPELGRPPVVRLHVLEQEVEVGRLLHPEAATLQRPRTRSDCIDAVRPCPWVGCRHHLYLDVTPAGAIAYRNARQEVWDMDQRRSCALDVADDHPNGLVLREVGELLDITRQRATQIEASAQARVLDHLGRPPEEYI